MKKTFLIGGLALLSLASCKKDYSCSCTETANYADGETDIEVTNFKVEGATKAQAQAYCNEAVVTETYPSGNIYTTECSLSK